MASFRGLMLTRQADVFAQAVTDIDEALLPAEADVDIDVEYSTINYKDALAITSGAPVVRRFPMVPGIDGAGRVRASRHPDWKVGDLVIHNGFGVGESHWGCLAERARLKGEWLVPLPAGVTTRQAMSLGTAGYTAMLCLMALQENNVMPGDGEILVTGASGGVGSVAITLLAHAGYRVVASTGKLNESDYLRELGATEVVDRAVLSAPGKPLQAERWAGVVDSVGSHTLVNACAQTRYGGAVTACGLAQGMDFPASVAPFILRGVKLVGVDSVMAPQSKRRAAWQRLAAEMDMQKLATMTTDVALEDVVDQARQLRSGVIRGRLVVPLHR
jgi:acrylyl-CoA reductase (NADPH)